MIRLRNDLAILGEAVAVRSSVWLVVQRLLLSLAVMPVNKRSVARGTGDMVVNKLGKALVEDGLARGELRVPLQ